MPPPRETLVQRIERFLEALFSQGFFRSIDVQNRITAGGDAGPAAPPGESAGTAEPEDDEPERPRSELLPAERPVARRPAPPAHDAAPRLLLTIDDAGQFLVAGSADLVIGHLRSGEADLPFLADVGKRHARVVRRESLHGGSEWRIEPQGSESVLRNGSPVATSDRLRDGDEIKLGGNVSFRFRTPDPASASAVLDLLHGAECLGAAHVILFADGPGGRVRIGAAGQRHVRVPGLIHGVSMVLDGERLVVECEAGVRSGEGPSRGTFALPFPPPQRVDLAIGKAADGRPPFGLALAPVEAPPRGPGKGL